jgi:hypothetical protein
MTRRRCLDCQDGRHCRHSGYVPAGSILAPCRYLDCDPQPIQARLFSHALVENDLGGCADCGQPATKLLVGGPASPTSACARFVSTAATWSPHEAATWPMRNGPAGASRPFHGLRCASSRRPSSPATAGVSPSARAAHRLHIHP